MLQKQHHWIVGSFVCAALLTAPCLDARQSASVDVRSAELAPIGWIAGTWLGHQGPPAPQGSDVEMFVRWAPTGRVLLMDLTIVHDTTRTPFMTATYYWHPGTKTITMWQMTSAGVVNDGRVVSVSPTGLRQELHVTDPDGRAHDVRTQFVRDGSDAFRFISSTPASSSEEWSDTAPGIRFVRRTGGGTPMAAFVGLTALQLGPSDARAATAVCEQSRTPKTRVFKVDDRFTVSGAGTRQDGASTIWVWTGESCAAWVRATGQADVDSAWQRLVLPEGAAFEAFQDDEAGTRVFKISPSARSLSVNGRAILPTAADEAWLAGMVREFVRRSGLHAADRAASIVRSSGIHGILAEAQEISGPGTRARYLAAGIPVVAPGARAAFLGDAGRLLDHGSAWAQFLAAVPADWSREDGVLAAIYAVTAGVEPDAIVERVLRQFAPPHPIPDALRPFVERMVDSLQSVERRTALREALLGR